VLIEWLKSLLFLLNSSLTEHLAPFFKFFASLVKKTRMRNTLLCFLLPFLLFACNQDTASYKEDLMQEAPQTAEPSAPPKQKQGEGLKIIRTIDLRLQVEKVAESTQRIQNLASTFKADITHLEEVNTNYSISTNFIIRVPSDDLERLLEALETEATFVHHKRMSTEDVTLQYVDVESRLQTKKTVRDRYLELLRTKAGNLEEVLAAEEKIRVVQEEIEATEAKLRQLQDRIQRSTIHLEIYEQIQYREQPKAYEISFWSRLSKSFSVGWEIFLNLILGVIRLWPIWILLALFWGFRKRIFPRWRNKNKPD